MPLAQMKGSAPLLQKYYGPEMHGKGKTVLSVRLEGSDHTGTTAAFELSVSLYVLLSLRLLNGL